MPIIESNAERVGPGPRRIFTHCSNLCNNSIRIEAIDPPGDGGANHRYDITGFDNTNNPSNVPADGFQAHYFRTCIVFQNGPIKEVGVNGVTNEAMLAIVQDRLEGFQRGKFACPENDGALQAVRKALSILDSRTKRRDDAGVEGTHGTALGDALHGGAA